MVSGWTGRAIMSLALAGCAESVFVCTENEDCSGAHGEGRCEETRYCSFPDDECASGSRYGDLAGDGLEGKCVQAPTGEEGSGGGSSGMLEVPVSCGNDVLEDGEVCDGADFGALDCAALGFGEGELLCADDCSEVSTTQCTSLECRLEGEPCSGPSDCCNSGCGRNGSICMVNNVNVCCT